MSYAEKDTCDSIEYNYRIYAFRYTIIMEKDKYQIYGIRKHRNLSNRVVYTSVIYKLYNNVAISNKPPTVRDFDGFMDYSYARIFI